MARFTYIPVGGRRAARPPVGDPGARRLGARRRAYRRRPYGPGVGLLLLLAATTAAAAGGCVYLPVTEYTYDHRGHQPIDDAAVRSMRPGRTTRDEAVARLGPPTCESPGGEGLAYAWSEFREVRLDQYWWLLRLGGYPDLFAWADGPRLSGRTTERHLELRFDPAGTLRSARVRDGPPDQLGPPVPGQ